MNLHSTSGMKRTAKDVINKAKNLQRLGKLRYEENTQFTQSTANCPQGKLSITTSGTTSVVYLITGMMKLSYFEYSTAY